MIVDMLLAFRGHVRWHDVKTYVGARDHTTTGRIHRRLENKALGGVVRSPYYTSI